MERLSQAHFIGRSDGLATVPLPCPATLPGATGWWADRLRRASAVGHRQAAAGVPRRGRPLTGSVLDAGCGTGENALYFAGRGRTVTGIDFLDEPISRAKRKAAERGLPATFLVQDALTLKRWSERFDSVIDSGLFHVFSDEGRPRYVEGLAAMSDVLAAPASGYPNRHAAVGASRS
jgi:SAM-dependent methyltransferase